MKSSWAYHNGGRIMRESKAHVAEIQEKKRQDLKKRMPEIKKQRDLRRKAEEEAFCAAWDKLEAGDDLSQFMIQGAVIKKKNLKSVLLIDGHKLTQADVFGAI